MNTNDPTDSRVAVGVSRRTVLSVSVAGAGVLALAACSKAPSPSPAPASSASTAGSSAPASTPAGTEASSPTSSAAAGGKVLASLSDIQIGSAIAAKGADGGDILISRTGSNTVVAFSAVCPHQGCTVANSFACPCHGSTFDPKTGAHLSGPAPTGLSTVPVTVSGQNVVAG